MVTRGRTIAGRCHFFLKHSRNVSSLLRPKLDMFYFPTNHWNESETATLDPTRQWFVYGYIWRTFDLKRTHMSPALVANLGCHFTAAETTSNTISVALRWGIFWIRLLEAKRPAWDLGWTFWWQPTQDRKQTGLLLTGCPHSPWQVHLSCCWSIPSPMPV